MMHVKTSGKKLEIAKVQKCESADNTFVRKCKKK